MEGEFSQDDDGESQPQQEQSTYCLSIERQQSDCSVNNYGKKICQFEKIQVKQEEQVEVEQKPRNIINSNSNINSELQAFSQQFILEQYKKFQEAKKKQLQQNIPQEKPNKKFQKIANILDEMLNKLNINHEKIREMSYIIILFNFIKGFHITKKVADNTSEFKNNSFENISMAIIMIACRNLQLPLPQKKIIGLNKIESKLKEISQKCVNKCLKKIKKLFEDSENQEIAMGSYDPVALIDKISGLILEKGQPILNMPKISELAKKIVINSNNLNLKSSSHAITIAVCALWLSSHLQKNPFNLKEICTEIGINSQAIRNYYREIYPWRIFLVCGKNTVPEEVEKFIQKCLPIN